MTIGLVAFSHWILDVIVHRPDLPILPGNVGGLPLLGLGLWRFPTVSAFVELALVLVGAYLYHRAATSLPAHRQLTRVCGGAGRSLRRRRLHRSLRCLSTFQSQSVVRLARSATGRD